MPSDTRVPAAQGTWNQATLIVGSSKPAAMALNDDGSSYITISPPGSLIDSYTTAGWPASIATVSNVVCGFRGGWTGAGSAPIAQCGIICPHGSVAGANTTASWWTTSFFSPTHPGGGSWSAADCVNSTELDVVSTTATGTTAFSYVWLAYDYTVAGGSFLIFASWLLPLVGAALNAESFARAWHLMARSRDTRFGFTRFYEHEVREAWREWQSYRHPKYFLLRAA